VRLAIAILGRIFAVFIVSMMLAVPAVAADAAPLKRNSAPDLGHVESDECDAIGLNADGDLEVEAESTLPGPLLTPAIHQALEATDSATGSACVDVVFDGETLNVNGHIETCGGVTDSHDGNPGSLIIGDVPIVIGTNASIGHATLVAEVGNGEACMAASVTDNAVVVEILSSACVTVTQSSEGLLELPDGGLTWSLAPDELIDPAGVLVIGTAVEAGLEVEAFWDQDSGDTGSIIEVVTLDDCAGPISTPPPLIPDTAMRSPGQ
jgi:hypothetical protein